MRGSHLVGFDLIFTSFTGLLEVGYFLEAGIHGFLHTLSEGQQQCFSAAFKASSGTLGWTLRDRLEIGLGGEADRQRQRPVTTVGNDRFHWKTSKRMGLEGFSQRTEENSPRCRDDLRRSAGGF